MEADGMPAREAGAVWRRVDDGVVVLNPRDGQYFSLDDVGGRIWELCDGSRTVADIVALLAAEYEARPAVIETDARELIAELVAEGLVH